MRSAENVPYLLRDAIVSNPKLSPEMKQTMVGKLGDVFAERDRLAHVLRTGRCLRCGEWYTNNAAARAALEEERTT